MQLHKFLFTLMVCSLFFFSCQKEKTGTIELLFTNTIDEQPVQFNELIYTNIAGNKYQVDEVRYFISRVFLIDAGRRWIEVKQDDGIHYVDFSIPNTLTWKISDMPQRNYTAISFVFGLDSALNTSNRFVNAPECNFAWPENLGGGYHYMQINGFFENKDGNKQSLNIHTGIGQLYENDTIKAFVHNTFIVTLPVKYAINEDNPVSLTLNMEIQRWFGSPFKPYNFNTFGSEIMKNQKAQQLLQENGRYVFSVISD